MCGICGFRSKQNIPLEKMTNILAHRGPDDSGIYKFKDIGLGHRRLSIIDLKGGHQPMLSLDGQFIIVLNGEIYNYLELKKDLAEKGAVFNTASDTEVLLQMYIYYGKDMLRYLNGEFAFVIYDLRKDTLFGARDRLGIRPFYYTYNDSGFFFASEIKAILETGIIKPVINPASLDLFFSYRYIPGQNTIYKDIYKILPGQAFEQSGNDAPVFWEYWQIPQETKGIGLTEALEKFEQILSTSLAYRLISDVPLGVFFSGGLDSATLVAIMSKSGYGPIRTFTAGFSNMKKVDESSQASLFAKHYKCEHHNFMVSPETFELLPKIIWHMDEPFADAILMPTYLLSQAASQKVKVVLTGEGADEGLMGYVHHKALARAFRFESLAPGFSSTYLSKLISCLPVFLLDRIFDYPSSLGALGRKRVSKLLSCVSNRGSAYQLLTSLFTEEEKNELYGPWLKKAKTIADQEYFHPLINRINKAQDPLQEIYLYEIKHWLADNILNKQDRMTMANSIEGRVPFLDHRLVEFLATVPLQLKLHNGKGKFLLRKLFNTRYSVWGIKIRHKQPFYMPLDKDFRKPYQKLINKYLDCAKIDERFFSRKGLAKLLRRAEKPSLLGDKQVMALVMFQIWLDVFKPEWN